MFSKSIFDKNNSLSNYIKYLSTKMVFAIYDTIISAIEYNKYKEIFVVEKL